VFCACLSRTRGAQSHPIWPSLFSSTPKVLWWLLNVTRDHDHDYDHDHGGDHYHDYLFLPSGPFF